MDLKDQFARLQQQQQQKLERRKKKKEKNEKENKTDVSTAFGISDDLGLQVCTLLIWVVGVSTAEISHKMTHTFDL